MEVLKGLGAVVCGAEGMSCWVGAEVQQRKVESRCNGAKGQVQNRCKCAECRGAGVKVRKCCG